jgi:hypothetical protein
MSYVCLWSPSWPTGAAFPAELTAALLQHAPRVLVGANGRVWADARGLDAGALAAVLLDVAQRHGFTSVHAGAATTVIAAELAATKSTAPLIVVKPGIDREFIAPFAVAVLEPPTLLDGLLEGIGVDTCGALARLDAEHIEVRLGAEGLKLWKLARADDQRMLFAAPLRALPSASVEWVDYALRDGERMLFVINALANTVCTALASEGQRARELAIVFGMEAGRKAEGGRRKEEFVHRMRSARPTANQKSWMRLIRTTLDRITLPDAVSGVTLRAEAVTGNDGVQGDLFDRGFSSAPEVERAVSQLMDDQGDVVLTPRNSAHPLVEARTEWLREEPAAAAGSQKTVAGSRPQSTGSGLPTPGFLIVFHRRTTTHQIPVPVRALHATHRGPELVLAHPGHRIGRLLA